MDTRCCWTSAASTRCPKTDGTLTCRACPRRLPSAPSFSSTASSDHPRLAPMRAGLTAEEVRERFSNDRWELISAEPVKADDIRAVCRRVDETFEVWRYRLRRR